MKFYGGIILAMLVFSCQKKSSNFTNEKVEPSAYSSLDSGMVIINEVVYRASAENEFGKDSDWIELFNTSSQTIVLEEGDLTVTDNPSQENKFGLPEIKIPPKGYFVLWCDGENTVDRDVHTNFKLSSKGESVSLFYKGQLLDQVYFDSVGAEYESYQRVQDGASEWTYSEETSLGTTNS